MTTQREREKEEARKTLLQWVKPGDTVFTILRHVSRSGMQRHIGLVIFHKGADLHPNYSASRLMGYPLARGNRDALSVNGCGMDMGFDVVYNLGRYLWPKGYRCPGKKCCSNDHSNGQREYGKGIFHTDGGYALRHRWL